MDKALVTIFGIVLIGFIYWFFLMKRERVVAAGKSLQITVEGGYNPETISVKRGEKTTLTFLRTDPTTCLEEVVFPDFSMRKALPLNQKVDILLSPKEVGEYVFHCGMNMYHGKLIVTE